MATVDDYRYVVLAAVERVRAKAEQGTGTDAYEEGRKMAYFECLQAILAGAETAGLTAAEVGMADFNPGDVIGVRG